ncbi:1,4-dihydroxy-2-naphthoate octaprenyltransferase [Proteiniphilum sp. UBA5384]|uniref:1,4-dihydroxy-2-naphthoate octaprenyltransferase n=1 Tax=Proteiniphilum sp. UBA5384 TaxID=1947279 RepID=UPI0025D32DC9|nr:1,4-dihydroxy-2-naphthoate octaprenyltransferase [Proteiniphilum sp. UBA5384]
MSTVKNWISAFRLRTLFLGIATVVLGSGLALHEGSFSMATFGFTLLLAVSIQILANLSNDLGDFQKGTDTTGRREGPARTLQSGKISAREMKKAIASFSIICMVTGVILVMSTVAYITRLSAILLIVIGGISILAALFYTLGKYAYGYKGWGDLLAFIFFGPVPVIGTYFLHTHSFGFQSVLPSIGIGIISTMILNINNMRDIENDKASEKTTLAVKLGIHRAKIYHAGLTITSFLCFLGYNILYEPAPWYRYLYMLVYLFLFRILVDVYKKNGQALDPYLKLTSLSGFLLAITFVTCINL